jgi:transcriptional regulator with XRE-family HTH domain
MSILISGMDKKHAIRSPQDLGGLIAEARRGRGQSQRELAAEFGVSQAWVSRVERGYQKTWLGQVFRLAVYLGIELDARIGKPMDKTSPAKADAGGYLDLDQLV